MSRDNWDLFVAEFQRLAEIEEAGGGAGAGEDDLPLLLYARPREGTDGADGEQDIVYIALDESCDELVTYVCLDRADPASPSVMLDLLERNVYVSGSADPVFAATPDGKAVVVSVRHPLRTTHAPAWFAWLTDFLPLCRSWNDSLARLGEDGEGSAPSAKGASPAPPEVPPAGGMRV